MCFCWFLEICEVHCCKTATINFRKCSFKTRIWWHLQSSFFFTAMFILAVLLWWALKTYLALLRKLTVYNALSQCHMMLSNKKWAAWSIPFLSFIAVPTDSFRVCTMWRWCCQQGYLSGVCLKTFFSTLCLVSKVYDVTTASPCPPDVWGERRSSA